MSESPNSSESPSTKRFSSSHSESPVSSESSLKISQSSGVNKQNYSIEENIQKAKHMLKTLEENLIYKNLNDKEAIELELRCTMIDYEDALIANPTYTNLLICYEEKISKSNSKKAICDFIVEALNELKQNERKNNSKLKYW